MIQMKILKSAGVTKINPNQLAEKLDKDILNDYISILKSTTPGDTSFSSLK